MCTIEKTRRRCDCQRPALEDSTNSTTKMSKVGSWIQQRKRKRQEIAVMLHYSVETTVTVRLRIHGKVDRHILVASVRMNKPQEGTWKPDAIKSPKKDENPESESESAADINVFPSSPAEAYLEKGSGNQLTQHQEATARVIALTSLVSDLPIATVQQSHQNLRSCTSDKDPSSKSQTGKASNVCIYPVCAENASNFETEQSEPSGKESTADSITRAKSNIENSSGKKIQQGNQFESQRHTQVAMFNEDTNCEVSLCYPPPSGQSFTQGIGFSQIMTQQNGGFTYTQYQSSQSQEAISASINDMGCTPDEEPGCSPPSPLTKGGNDKFKRKESTKSIEVVSILPRDFRAGNLEKADLDDHVKEGFPIGLSPCDYFKDEHSKRGINNTQPNSVPMFRNAEQSAENIGAGDGTIFDGNSSHDSVDPSDNEQLPYLPSDAPFSLPAIEFRTAGRSSLISVSEEDIVKAKKLLLDTNLEADSKLHSHHVVSTEGQCIQSDMNLALASNLVHSSNFKGGNSSGKELPAYESVHFATADRDMKIMISDDSMVNGKAFVKRGNSGAEHSIFSTVASPICFTTSGKRSEINLSKEAIIKAGMFWVCNKDEHSTTKPDCKQIDAIPTKSIEPVSEFLDFVSVASTTRGAMRGHVSQSKQIPKLNSHASKIENETEQISDQAIVDSSRLFKSENPSTIPQIMSFATAGKGIKLSVSVEAMAKASILLSSDSAPPVVESQIFFDVNCVSASSEVRTINQGNPKDALNSVMDELSGSGDQDCSLEHPPDNAVATPVSFSTAGKGIIVQVSGEAYTKANKLLQAENVSYDSSGFCLKDKVAGSVASFEPSNISGRRQKVNTAGHGVGAKNSKLTIEDDVIIASKLDTDRKLAPSVSFTTAGKGATLYVSEDARSLAIAPLSSRPRISRPEPISDLVSFASAGKGIIVQVSDEDCTKANEILEGGKVNYVSSGFHSQGKVAGSFASSCPLNTTGSELKVHTDVHSVDETNSYLSIAVGSIIASKPGTDRRSSFLTAEKGVPLQVSEDARSRAITLLSSNSQAFCAEPVFDEGNVHTSTCTASSKVNSGPIVPFATEAMDEFEDQSTLIECQSTQCIVSENCDYSLQLSSSMKGTSQTVSTAAKLLVSNGTMIQANADLDSHHWQVADSGDGTKRGKRCDLETFIDETDSSHMFECECSTALEIKSQSQTAGQNSMTPSASRSIQSQNSILRFDHHEDSAGQQNQPVWNHRNGRRRISFGPDDAKHEDVMSISTATPKGATLKAAIAVTRSTNMKNPYQRKRTLAKQDLSPLEPWSPVAIHFKEDERIEGENFQRIQISGPSRGIKKASTSDGKDECVVSNDEGSLKNLVNSSNFCPPHWTEHVQDCLDDGVHPVIIEIDAMNATKLRFDADSGSPCTLFGRPNPSGKKAIGGSKDLRDALVTLGCEGKSFTDKWLANHTRWIVWKLASIERRFSSSIAREYCTFDRLVSCLKSRHVKEIEGGQRSALRKILNRDVAASRMMILCVSYILPPSTSKKGHANENQPISSQASPESKIELTDGWYGVQAVLDSKLRDLVECGRIVVGTKLLVCNAVLKGADDGIDPLDDKFTSVKSNSIAGLALLANSTRLAKWDAKLGFVPPSKLQRQNRGVLLVRSLSDVVLGGGNISMVDLIVCRVYPVLYLEKTGKASMGDSRPPVLSIFEEHDRRIEFERKKQKAMETMSDSIQRECARVVDEMAPDLWKVLLKSSFPESFYEQLSAADKYSIDNWKEKRTGILFDRVRNELNAQLEVDESIFRESTPFIRAYVKSHTPVHGSCQGATLTLWNHTEEQLALLKEGTVLRVQNLSVRDSKYEGLLQLTAGAKTLMGPSPSGKLEQLPGYIPRRFTKLVAVHAMSKKLENRNLLASPDTEVDTVGVVLKVAVEEHQYSIYMTDESGLIVRVIREGSLKDTDPLKCLSSNAEQNLESPIISSFRDLRVLPYDRMEACAVVVFTSNSSTFTKPNSRASKLQTWAAHSSLLLRTAALLDVGLPMTLRVDDDKSNKIALGYIMGLQPQKGSQTIKVQVDCHALSDLQVWYLPLFLFHDTIALLEGSSGRLSLKPEEESKYANLKVLGKLLGGRGVLLRFGLKRMGTGYEIHEISAVNAHALANIYLSMNEADV